MINATEMTHMPTSEKSKIFGSISNTNEFIYWWEVEGLLHVYQAYQVILLEKFPELHFLFPLQPFLGTREEHMLSFY